MFEEALTRRLLASPDLRGKSNEVHWGVIPEGEPLPCLVLQVVMMPRDYTHDGPSDLVYPRIQIDSYGRTYAEAKVLSRAVLSEIEKAHRDRDVDFEDGINLTDSDDDPKTAENGTQRFRVSQDFLIPFRSII